MKINKYFLGLAVVLMGGLSSCNTDVEGVKYTPMNQNVSFETAKPSTVTTAESSLTIPVRIIRSMTNGSYTANFTATASEEGIFTNDANGTVTFAEGQGVAIINVKADNLAKGKDYTYTLTLSEKDVATTDTITKSQNISTVITIHSDYNWVSAGSCTFVDYTFSENGSAAKGVAIQHAEGTNLYRIVKPWATIYKGGSDTGIQFTYNNSDNTIKLVYDENGYVATYQSGGNTDIFVWLEQYEGTYCIVKCSENVYECEMLGMENGEGYYTGFAFAFQWTEGWPGQK